MMFADGNVCGTDEHYCVGSDGVFGEAEEEDEVVGSVEGDGGSERSGHGGGTAHVVFHSGHAVFGFEGHNPGVVHYPLPDEGHRPNLSAATLDWRRGILHDHRPRRRRRRLPDPVQTAEPSLVKLLPHDLPERHPVPQILRDPPAFVGVGIRSEFGRGRVDQSGDESYPFGEVTGGMEEGVR